MATQSVRIGWRPYVNLTSAQAATYLLDSYSGSAAAYSLRKIKSSYTGSAIRVRRSSDNTESNIGFDSDGNLDTYSLSAFVGTGDGFVTTWYDQSGNVKNATQTTAANQPYIVVSGTLQTLNGKPSLFFNGESKYLDCGYLNNGTKPANFSTFISANFTAVNQTRSIFSSMDAGGNGKDTYNTFGIHSAIAYQMFGGAGGGIYYKYWRTSNVPTQSLPYLFEQHYKSNISPFIGTFYWNNTAQSTTEWLQGSSTISGGTEFKTSIGRSGENNGGYHQGFVQEIATYFSDQMSNRSGINTNLNTYYSVYPNPSSVWNLLTAAYNADTKSLPSLKTSLFAVYNGESNTNDSKGTNNGTAVGGLTYTTGKIGNAFNFNGTNSYVDMGDVLDVGTSSWTYSMWFNANQLTAGTYLVLFSKSIAASGAGRVWVTTYGNQLQFNFDAAGNSNNINTQTTLTFNTNTWYHIVCVLDRNDKLKMYVNGTLVVLNTILGDNNLIPYSAVNYNTNNPFRIGTYTAADNTSILGTFNGKIDALNVWNRVLTASEITELYNSGNGAQYITDSFYKPTTNDALNTYNGTAQGGLTYGVGKVGTAFQFNGTNAYVQFPNNAFNSLTGSFSVSAWFKTASSIQNVSNYIFNNRSGNTFFQNPNGFIVSQYGNSICFDMHNNTNNYALLRPAYTFSPSTWYHVTATKLVNGEMRVYLNGTQIGVESNTFNPTYLATVSKPCIGVDLYGSKAADYFAQNGFMVDALNIWNKVLTQSEITELYNSGAGKQYPN